MEVSEPKVPTSNTRAISDIDTIATNTALTGWFRWSLDKHLGIRLSEDIRCKIRDRAMVSARMTVGDATNAPALMTTWTSTSFETENSGAVGLTCV